tara:strand:+ start:10413 stop:11327 length:915 start_codon:yes stop_codon:yes gene_type:complete
MNVCDCKAGLSNTGLPNCIPIFGITSSLILVPIYANDGTKNGVDLSAVVPTWSSLVNEVDASKRWFPLPAFENVELPKADSLFEEANSGRQVFLRQGKRSFSGELWAEDSTPTFLGKMVKSRCVDFGLYIVDVSGNLIGSEDNGYLRPIPVDNPSWDPKFMFSTDSTTQKILLGFDFNRLFDESTMSMITVKEASQDFTQLEGLIDVNLLNTVVNVTGATFDASFDYGTAYEKIIYTGAILPADWSISNITQGTTFTPDTVTENPDGTYALDYTISGSGMVVGNSVKIAVSKSGFDGEITATAV